MEPSSGIIAILVKLVLGEVAKVIVAGVKNQLQPDRMKELLKTAIEAATAKQPQTGGLFYGCQEKAAAEFLTRQRKSLRSAKRRRDG